MNKLKIAAAGIGSAVLGFVMTMAAHAQSIPTVGTSDIAGVGGPILTVLVADSEYVLQVFGPPLFVFALILAVFFAIYHRVKVGHWL